MHPEEYKYLVLNTVQGWSAGFCKSIRIDSSGQISLWPERKPALSEGRGYLTGFAIDKNGNLYVVDAENCLIYRYCYEAEAFKRIMCIGMPGNYAGQFLFSSPQAAQYWGGLALTRSFLYVADSFNHRIQCFYRHNFQIRYVLGALDSIKRPISGQKSGQFCLPKDIHTDSQGNLYVLDHGNKRIQRFDKFGSFLNEISLTGLFTKIQLESITIDQQDFLYIISEEKKHIIKCDRFGENQVAIGNFDDIKTDFQPAGIAVDNAGVIYVGEKGAGELKIHRFTQKGEYLGSVGNYRNRCYQLAADNDGNLYASCGQPGEIVLYKGNASFVRQGVYFSKCFDSTVKETIWHRVVLDAEITEKAKVDVFYYASDSPFDWKEIEKNNHWTKVLSSPRNGLTSKEGLFINAKGQYLRLKIELSGDQQHSPVIKQVKLYFPRLSYLRYLPATYQEDEAGSEFLERFLSIFESQSFDLEQQIEQMVRYFDPLAMPDEFLSWLATWLGLVIDENLPENKKRAWLANAFPLFKLRGTRRGLEKMVELFTGKTPRILEHYYLQYPMVLRSHSVVGLSTVVGKAFTRRLILEETSVIGDFLLEDEADPPEQPFEAGAFDFTIFADTTALENEAQVTALKRLILAEKPAYTNCRIRISEGTMQLGVHPYLGVDSILGKGFTPMRLGIESTIGVKTFLGARSILKGTIGNRSRISINTILQ